MTQNKQRFEIKFLIPAALESIVLHELLVFTRPDPQAGANGAYRVRSLYFDNANLDAWREKCAGLLNRSKFRIRCYPEASTPVRFLEQKKRFSNRISKPKVALTEEQYRCLLRGHFVSFPEQVEVWDAFWSHNARSRMNPLLNIEYLRRPLVGKVDRGLRVTFDRQITVQKAQALESSSACHPVLRPGHSLLEIKFNHTCPSWVNRLVQKYSLTDQAFSKYCLGLETLGRRGVYFVATP